MQRMILLLAGMILTVRLAPAQVVALTESFTYQGRLNLNGAPPTGTFDFQFKLFDRAVGGSQIGPTNTVNDLQVRNGLFTTRLNYGPGGFTSDERQLEISVRAGASTGAYTTLTPRQVIGATPVAATLVPHRSTIKLPAEAMSHNNFVTPFDEGLIFPFNNAAVGRCMIPMPEDWDRRSTITITLFYRPLDDVAVRDPIIRFEMRCTGRRVGSDLFVDPPAQRSIDAELVTGALSLLRRQRFTFSPTTFLPGGQLADVIQIQSLRRVVDSSAPVENFSGGVILMALEITYNGYK